MFVSSMHSDYVYYYTEVLGKDEKKAQVVPKPRESKKQLEDPFSDKQDERISGDGGKRRSRE